MIGATLLDRYRIEKMIGRGGMGLVYLAEQVDAQRKAVVKLLAPQWLDDGDAVNRFAREGTRLQQLAHPNVVQLLECGHHAEQFFIAMEYLDGEPLRRFLARRGRLALQEFTPIATQVLAAVGFAHDRNIMLRDIKPANIMLCEREGKANFVKLLDFGLAKLVDGDDEEVTKSHVIGTAGYLAPEQIKGEPVDLRVDVYALGVLFYLMLAGESPIVGENDGALLYNHVHGTPKPLGEHLPEGHNVPELLIALVHQCLEKDPQRRPADANEVAEALFECVPPKLFSLPKADEDSRRALREYRDSRDRGLEHDAGPVSSEWTKPVLRAAIEGSPADASAAALARPVRRPTPPPVRRPSTPDASGVPQHIADRSGSRGSRAAAEGGPRRPTPPPQPGEAPPRGRAAALAEAGRGARTSDAALRTDDGVVRSDAADARAADGAVRRGTPNVPEGGSTLPPLPQPRSRVPARPIAILEDPGSREAAARVAPIADVVEPAAGVVLPIVDPGTGALAGERGSGRIAVGGLPWPRRWLVAIGALALLAGGLAAWVVFNPNATPQSSATGAVAAAAATTSNASKSDSTPSPTSSGAPGAVVGPTPEPAAVAQDASTTHGAVDVRAIEGARIEVDGVDIGAAPRRVELTTGSHEIRIVAPGYAPWSETIEVGGGENPAVEARLKASGGSKKKPGKGVRTDEPVAEDDDFLPTTPASPDDEPEPPQELLPDKPTPPVPGTSGPRKPPPPPPAPDPSGNPNPFLPTTPKPADDPLLPAG